MLPKHLGLVLNNKILLIKTTKFLAFIDCLHIGGYTA